MARIMTYNLPGYAQRLIARDHHLLADEPTNALGQDLGMTPVELLLGSLASCTAITLQMYARRKEWDLGNMMIEVKSEDTSEKIELEIILDGKLDKSQIERLGQIAPKCPIARSLKACAVKTICRLACDQEDICYKP